MSTVAPFGICIKIAYEVDGPVRRLSALAVTVAVLLAGGGGVLLVSVNQSVSRREAAGVSSTWI